MKTNFVRVNDVKLHVVTDGPESGPLIVLLHGFPEHWPSYRHQIPALVREGFRVVVPDQRGYHLSDKPKDTSAYAIEKLTADVVKLIELQGREKAIVVGHDWGGVVAHHVAMHHQNVVEKLIILNSPHPKAMQREMKRARQLLRSWYFFYFMVPKIPESIFAQFPRASARLLLRGSSAVKSIHSDNDIMHVAEAMRMPGSAKAMLNWYRANMQQRGRPRTQIINAPTLLIWGEKDPALGIHLTDELQPWFRDIRIEKIPAAGHWVQHEAAQEVNRLMLGFL